MAGRQSADSLGEAKRKVSTEATKLVREALKEARSGDFSVPEDEKSKLEEKPTHELGKTLFEASADIGTLSKWRDANGMPVKCLMDVYEATGIVREAQAFKNRTGLSVIPSMQITCTRHTFEALKDFITDNWMWWPIDLIGDEKVIWKPGWEHVKRQFPHKIKAVIRNSLHDDFAATAFAPLVDDDLNAAANDMKLFFHDREKTKEEENSK